MLSFDNTYSRLPDRFYARVAPTKVGDPRVVKVNRALAELLGASPEELRQARARPFSSATRFRAPLPRLAGRVTTAAVHDAQKVAAPSRWRACSARIATPISAWPELFDSAARRRLLLA